MFPYLRDKIVIVNGHNAVGVYNLNSGHFHRINNTAGAFLKTLDGSKHFESFDTATQKFITNTIELNLVELSDFKIIKQQTQLDDVIRKVRPVKFAWVEITSKCNQKCVHCFLGQDLNRYPHVPKNKIFEYFETLHQAQAHQLIISGGEPTVHPDFQEIIERAATYTFRISLLSNASTPNFFKYIEVFTKNDIAVKVPVLGWGEVHDQMTGLKGSFGRTINNINAMLQAQVKVELGTTVTSINYQDVPKIREYANLLKIPLEVSPVYSMGFAKTNSNEVLSTGQKSIIDVCRNDKKQKLTEYRKPPANNRIQHKSDPTDYEAVNLRDYLTEHHECGQKIIAILSNGEVTPCLMLREKKYSLGSTTDFTLKEIIERRSDRAEAFGELMSLTDIPDCSGCEARFICKAGGCPASALANAGSLKLKNPMYQHCYYLKKKKI
jgi:radical SAM protein with 4Fe4S-binding SPASM domain